MGQQRAQGLMERISHVLREEQRALASAHGLALAQLDVLRYLGAANRFSDTVSALVDYVGATKGTLSQTVSALERKGLVRRIPDALDGRIQHCRVTFNGEAIVRASERAALLDGLSLSAHTVDQLDALLRDLLRARGGRAFGVCATCEHHRATREGRHCALLNVSLSDEDASRICREHRAPLVDTGARAP